jgi:hypothetical protein
MVTVWNTQSHSLRKKREANDGNRSGPRNEARFHRNLRTAADVLGTIDYANLSPIRQDFKAWAEDLVEATRSEISQLQASNP